MSFLRGWSPANSVQNSSDPSPSCQRKIAPPPTDEEMQDKMQYMIDLQYAAAQQTTYPQVTSPPKARDKKKPPLGPVPGASITPAAAAEAAAAAAAAGLSPPDTTHCLSTINNPEGRSIMGQALPLYPNYAATQETTTPPTTSVPNNTMEVGQGHIYFPNEYNATEQQQAMLPPPGMMTAEHYDVPHVDDPDPPKHHHHHHYGCYCCACFCNCLAYWKKAETLRRSFCYGAIDGMLTGSGILAAFLGMGIITAKSSTEVHFFVVAFSLAACTSDAICMALGHVWSTFVLTNASANERRMERLSFEQNRADAKGKLVDMLLSRGMLKIDAMSIADTLEGYPDIFVSALVGDSGYTLGDESLPSSASSGQFGLGDADGATPLQSLRVHRSYGQFDESEVDPEAAIVRSALGESRTEGMIMMFSFALFSVVPSLLFLWLSNVMNDNSGHSGGTTVKSMALSLTSVIMLLLGIWKSKFFDSNWIIFGIETVVVLWMCALSAYFLGLGLVTFVPALHGLRPAKIKSL